VIQENSLCLDFTASCSNEPFGILGVTASGFGLVPNEFGYLNAPQLMDLIQEDWILLLPRVIGDWIAVWPADLNLVFGSKLLLS
jgi:hypothetical protein